MDFAQYLPTFGGQEQMPQDDTMMQLELQRRMKFADALRQQEAPQGQMVSGHYVAPSWTQHLASLAGKYMGGQQEKAAMQKYGDYQSSQNAKLADLLKPETQLDSSYNESGNQPMITESQAMPDKGAFLAKALQARPDLAPKLLEMQLGNMFKEEAPMVVGQGAALTDKQGNVLYQNPKEVVPKSNYVNVQPDPSTGKMYGVNINTNRMEEIPGSAMTPKPAAAPVVRNMRQGNQEITQQWDADKNQWTTIASGNAFKPEGPVKLKEIPPTQRQAFSGNVASIKSINDAIAAAENAPEEMFGLKGGLGNAYMSRAYPDSVAVRQKITGVRAAKRHELSGSAVTPSENASTAPLLPEPTDDKKTTLTKLYGLRDNYETLNNSISGSFGDEYRPLNQQNQLKEAPKVATKRFNPATGKVEAVK
jgi:hypothetical protein